MDGAWLFVTAGHCLRQIEQNERSGYSISCRLHDTGGEGAVYPGFVPFDFSGAPKLHLRDDHYDYGIIEIDDVTKRTLAANNVQPLDESVWDKQPDLPSDFRLLGVPADSVVIEGRRTRFRSVLVQIEELPERPPYFEECDAPTFYGRLVSGDELPDIEGMSGGPIFSFFAVMMVFQLLFVWKMMPETKGVSLEDLEKQLKHGSHR